MLSGRMLCQFMEQLWPTMGNTFAFFLFFNRNYVFLMYQKNIIMVQDKIKFLHNKKGGLFSVAWENAVSD